jgi:hypothetical protein
VANGNRKCFRLGTLPVCGSDRGVDLAERIHALDLEQSAVRIVSESDVCGQRWVARLGRKLEITSIATHAAEPEYELLDPKVPSVGRLLVWVAPERQIETELQRRGNLLPGC